LGVKEELSGKVKILYDNQEVKNVHLLNIKFINTGNIPISSSDYEKQINISFNDHAKILTHEIVQEEPQSLGIEIKTNDNTFTLSSCLLNPKDSFSIKTLISDYEGLPTINCRIKGIKKIEKYAQSRILFFSSVAVLILGALYYNYGVDLKIQNKQFDRESIGIAIVIAAYISLYIEMFRNKEMRPFFMSLTKIIARK